MKKIGITGGIACGKTYVLNYIKQLGFKVASCDDIAHEIFETPECQQWLINNAPIEGKSSFTREEVRALILDYPDFFARYEEWIGPKIREKMLADEAEIVEVPLLYEKGLEDLFEFVWVIHTSSRNQISRLRNRLNCSEHEAIRLIGLQMDLEIKKKRADVCIDSGYTTCNQVLDNLLKCLIKLPQSVAPTEDSM